MLRIVQKEEEYLPCKPLFYIRVRIKGRHDVRALSGIGPFVLRCRLLFLLILAESHGCLYNINSVKNSCPILFCCLFSSMVSTTYFMMSITYY